MTPTQTYTVLGIAGTHGSISPTAQQVDSGNTASLTIAPDSGYTPTISGTCPGGSLAGDVYTSGVISADCAVVVLFSSVDDLLGLSVSDGRDFMREGLTARYLVMVANHTGNDMSGLHLNANASPAFDATLGLWCAVDGTLQQPTCTPAGSGPFNVTNFSVPAQGVMLWEISVPLLDDAPYDTADYTLRLTGPGVPAPITQTDSDTLVLLRDGFDHAGGDGTGEPPLDLPQP